MKTLTLSSPARMGRGLISFLGVEWNALAYEYEGARGRVHACARTGLARMRRPLAGV